MGGRRGAGWWGGGVEFKSVEFIQLEEQVDDLATAASLERGKITQENLGSVEHPNACS